MVLNPANDGAIKYNLFVELNEDRMQIKDYFL